MDGASSQDIEEPRKGAAMAGNISVIESVKDEEVEDDEPALVFANKSGCCFVWKCSRKIQKQTGIFNKEMELQSTGNYCRGNAFKV